MSSARETNLPVLHLDGDLPRGRFAIEASAGTGKTYSLTALVARHIAEWGLQPSQLLMVTFTRVAATDMRHRTRSQVRAIATALKEILNGTGEVMSEGLDPWMKAIITGDQTEDRRRLQHLEAFLATYDEATITTLHGFFHIVLNRVGLGGPVPGDVSLIEDLSDLIREVVADISVGVLAEDPEILGTGRTGKDALTVTSVQKELAASAQAFFNNLGSLIVPELQPGDIDTPLVDLPREKRWAVLVTKVITAVQERLERQDLLGFDSLVTAVRDLVDGPHGEALVAALRAQFKVVLVDEFQDTDHVQWSILSRVFASTDSAHHEPTIFGTVGDPKQAIYRFRGADIDAYREAVAGVEQTSALTTNYRSNQQLIAGVNALFEGVHFGSEDIEYRQVTSRSGPPDEGVVNSAALEIRWMAFSEAAGGGVLQSGLRKAEKEALAAGTLDKWKWNGNQAVEAIYADVAREIRTLLDGKQLIDKRGIRQEIRPGDIAILVSSHRNAERMQDILSLAGIPAMRYRTQSVFESLAAKNWQILLEALGQPTNSGSVRALVVSAFGDLTVEELAALNSETASIVVGEWQRRCAKWAERLQRNGLAGFYHYVRAHRGLEAAIVSRVGGERLLTDLDHIAEVLTGRPGLGRGATAADFRRELAALCRDTNRVNEYERRIESDDAAVHVATVHFSKGLEFPIVFLPTMFTRGKPQTPWVFNVGSQRFVDVAHKVEWSDSSFAGDQSTRQGLSHHADLGDEMRKFYVAATRAEQKLIVYWSPNSGAMESALGRVLLGRDESGRIVNDPVTQTPLAVEIRSNQVMEQMLQTVTQSHSSIELIALDSEIEPLVAERRQTPLTGELSVAVMNRQEPLRRPDWRKWSYSALVKGKNDAKFANPNDGAVAHDENVAEGDQDHMSGSEVRSDVLGTTRPILFPDGLRGTGFGSLVHSLFEHLDPSTDDFVESLSRELRQRSRTLSPQAVAILGKAMAHVVQTPLGSNFAHQKLSSIPGKDRLAEVKFDFRLPHDDGVSMAEIGHLMERHLPEGDPFVSYARSWSGNTSTQRLAGYLYGEIDAVFRVDTAQGPDSRNETKYVVCDYKTNRLHAVGSRDPLEAYSHQNMAVEMAQSNYVLQALLYSVALHRYLGLRLPGYEPDRHLGGIAYLFVRGMIGTDSYREADNFSYGVFTWMPPIALITDLDARFARSSNGGGS